MALNASSGTCTETCYLYNLPNELLFHMLTPLSTPDLLPLTLVSHRIYAVILRVLHGRLYVAPQLHDHALMLECFIPSLKLTEPPYFCTYHGTDGLSPHFGLSETHAHPARLGEFKNLYSRFRPHRREFDEGGRRVILSPHPAGNVPGSRTHTESSSTGSARRADKDQMIRQTLNLEGHELFTQLCAVVNIVKFGPKPGVFKSFVEVEDSVLRVWREWLEKMTEKRNGEDEAGGSVGAEEVHTALAPGIDEVNVLWVGSAKNTGIRFNVREKRLRRDLPVIMHINEDAPVSYEIEYDELIVRTSHLLLMLEKSYVQQDNTTGKAVVFGSWG